MIKLIHEVANAILSYFTAFIAIIITLPLIKIAGWVLLVSRLITDVPPAINRIKEIVNGLCSGSKKS